MGTTRAEPALAGAWRGALVPWVLTYYDHARRVVESARGEKAAKGQVARGALRKTPCTANFERERVLDPKAGTATASDTTHM